MSKFARAVAVAAMILIPALAQAHGFGLLRSRSAYYCPMTVQCVPVVAVPVCIVLPPNQAAVRQPSEPARTYAPPTAAPPSAGPTTPEPPLAAPKAPAKPSSAPPDRSLGFGESTSFYDSYAVVSPSATKPGGERCAVDFWNLTDKDLLLRIGDGAARTVPHGKSLPAAVGREFTWQVDGRETQTTHIADGEAALQIVIRR